jgi:hypothetical protein
MPGGDKRVRRDFAPLAGHNQTGRCPLRSVEVEFIELPMFGHDPAHGAGL